MPTSSFLWSFHCKALDCYDRCCICIELLGITSTSFSLFFVILHESKQGMSYLLLTIKASSCRCLLVQAKKDQVKIWSCKYCILPQFVGCYAQIYNGKGFVGLKIVE
jgi:hypothetical protein